MIPDIATCPSMTAGALELRHERSKQCLETATRTQDVSTNNGTFQRSAHPQTIRQSAVVRITIFFSKLVSKSVSFAITSLMLTANVGSRLTAGIPSSVATKRDRSAADASSNTDTESLQTTHCIGQVDVTQQALREAIFESAHSRKPNKAQQR